MLDDGAAFFTLPGSANLFAFFGPKGFANALGESLMLPIPGMGGGALNSTVGVTSEANCATGKDICARKGMRAHAHLLGIG